MNGGPPVGPDGSERVYEEEPLGAGGLAAEVEEATHGRKGCGPGAEDSTAAAAAACVWGASGRLWPSARGPGEELLAARVVGRDAEADITRGELRGERRGELRGGSFARAAEAGPYSEEGYGRGMMPFPGRAGWDAGRPLGAVELPCPCPCPSDSMLSGCCFGSDHMALTLAALLAMGVELYLGLGAVGPWPWLPLGRGSSSKDRRFGSGMGCAAVPPSPPELTHATPAAAPPLT